MTAIFVDIFPICVLLVILCDLHRNRIQDRKNTWFRLITVLTLVVLLSDIAAWLPNGNLMPGVKPFLIAANMIYFGVGAIVSYLWFLFTHYILYGEGIFRQRRIHFAIATIPLIIFLLILMLKTDWIIQFTADNHYRRGQYFCIQTVLGLGYILLASARALTHGLREKVPAWRREDFLLSSFVLYPLFGAIVQLINMQIVLLWPLATVSLLLYYLNMRHEDIQKDVLTGLYNRGWLDEYLTKSFRDSTPADEWYLFMIDLDHFKQINDTYGHAVGDEVLKRTADILKEVFSLGDAFIARYGGDEFAIVIKRPESMIPKYVANLEAAVAQANATAGTEYEISLSYGGAAYKYGRYACLEEFISQVDRNMYRHKNECRLSEQPGDCATEQAPTEQAPTE